MRAKAKDPALIRLIGEFLKVYLPSIKNRDQDTIDSYRHSMNVYLHFLQDTQGLTLITVRRFLPEEYRVLPRLAA